MHKIDQTGFLERSKLGAGMAIQCHNLAPGLDAYLCEFSNTSGGRCRAVAPGFEFVVPLSGSWRQRGLRSGARCYEPGQVAALSPGELYDFAYDTSQGSGCVVFLTVAAQSLPGLQVRDEDVAIADPHELKAPRLIELCESLRSSLRRGDAIPRGTEATVRGHLQSRCTSRPRDGVAIGRRELERHFASDLYLAHIADAAGMHPTVFLRKFQQRYGMSPMRYRTRLRLNQAARLGVDAPKRSWAEIAQRCGFENLSYFYRSYRAYYGTRPTQHMNRPSTPRKA